MNMRVDKYGKCGTTELQKAKAGDEKRNVRGVIQQKQSYKRLTGQRLFALHSIWRCDLLIAGIKIKSSVKNR